ncbi:hypothetical protein PPERSA_04346 [Pseudocohnilembus persalinus]|uniref:Uncharacterized protein n=1 Tax=Pseudocohnilembus persalinus TaxID=266149 RepID=A0A0V0QQH5_PSEPJ|nr:hypothetical protein PPERSA_04346 [Pseudocohnilembus persalinus]|eukprot:KRX04531.1 hypothetical protein PPERSA_04346 [Pseudocohnilembus persalinus]
MLSASKKLGPESTKQFLKNNLPEYYDKKQNQIQITPQIKDRKFYSDTSFWNNESRLTKRNQSYLHHDKTESAISIAKEKQQQDREFQQKKKREKVQFAKEIGLQKFAEKQHQKAVLQKESRQILSDKQYNLLQNSDLQDYYDVRKSIIGAQSWAKDLKLNNKQPNNKWNMMNQISKKNASFLVNEKVIQGQEQGIKLAKQKIKEEKIIENQRDLVKKQRIKEIREGFLAQHKKNLEKEQEWKIGVFGKLSKEKETGKYVFKQQRPQSANLKFPLKFASSIQQPHNYIAENKNKFYENQEKYYKYKDIEQEQIKELKQQDTNRIVSAKSQMSQNKSKETNKQDQSNLDTRLSKPKVVYYPENDYDYQEFRGLFLADLDQQKLFSENEIIQAYKNSNLVQNLMQQLSRPTTGGYRDNQVQVIKSQNNNKIKDCQDMDIIKTAPFVRNHESEEQILYDEIDQFENLLQFNAQKNKGFSKISAIENQFYQNQKGLFDLKNLKQDKSYPKSCFGVASFQDKDKFYNSQNQKKQSQVQKKQSSYSMRELKVENNLQKKQSIERDISQTNNSDKNCNKNQNFRQLMHQDSFENQKNEKDQKDKIKQQIQYPNIPNANQYINNLQQPTEPDDINEVSKDTSENSRQVVIDYLQGAKQRNQNENDIKNEVNIKLDQINENKQKKVYKNHNQQTNIKHQKFREKDQNNNNKNLQQKKQLLQQNDNYFHIQPVSDKKNQRQNLDQQQKNFGKGSINQIQDFDLEIEDVKQVSKDDLGQPYQVEVQTYQEL